MNEPIVCLHCKKILVANGSSAFCENCGEPVHIRDNVIIWPSSENSTEVKTHETIFQKITRAIKDGALIKRAWTKLRPYLTFPYRLAAHPYTKHLSSHSEKFYQAILAPNNRYSAYWAERYLSNLDLDPFTGKLALDFGCGRGRNVAHLLAAGFRVTGLDVAENGFWKNFQNTRFDIVNVGNTKLPYANNTFDLIIVNVVLGFFNETKIREIFEEFDRVLKLGGSIVLIESNARSHARKIMTAYYGKKPESLETIKRVASSYFRIKDQWYEGYYARFFPMTRNLIWGALQKDIGTWLIVDPRGDTLPPELRGLWVLRMHKAKT